MADMMASLLDSGCSGAFILRPSGSLETSAHLPQVQPSVDWDGHACQESCPVRTQERCHLQHRLSYVKICNAIACNYEIGTLMTALIFAQPRCGRNLFCFKAWPQSLFRNLVCHSISQVLSNRPLALYKNQHADFASHWHSICNDPQVALYGAACQDKQVFENMSAGHGCAATEPAVHAALARSRGDPRHISCFRCQAGTGHLSNLCRVGPSLCRGGLLHDLVDPILHPLGFLQACRGARGVCMHAWTRPERHFCA